MDTVIQVIVAVFAGFGFVVFWWLVGIRGSRER